MDKSTQKIIIKVKEECSECPFYQSHDIYNINKNINAVGHEKCFPSKCPILDKEVIVKRQVLNKD